MVEYAILIHLTADNSGPIHNGDMGLGSLFMISLASSLLQGSLNTDSLTLTRGNSLFCNNKFSQWTTETFHLTMVLNS